MMKFFRYIIILITFTSTIFFIKSCRDVHKVSLPLISTSAITEITETTAMCGGSITDDGGETVTARGVCWSNILYPTTVDDKTVDGSGTGDFTSIITGLTGGTTYYIRAYAINNAGTAYGDQRVFTTPSNLKITGFFPIAVWLQSPSNAIAYKSNGINMFVGLWNPLDLVQLNLLRNANMKVICKQNTFGLDNLGDTIIYGWMHGDEPDNAQWNNVTQKYDPCIDPAILINDYNVIKQNDPSRPVYLNLGQGVAYINYIGRGSCRGNTDMYKISNNGYLKACDIGSFDIYPVNNSDSETKGNLWYVAKGIDNLKLWSNNTIPVWCWIECTQIRETSSGKPVPSQVKSEIWMALIHGAKGFGYFCHSWYPAFDEASLLHDQTMIQAIKAINMQISSLANVLNSPTSFGYATVNSSNTLIPVDIMTKNVDGINYIFAVSMRSGNTTANFTVISGNNAEVLGESRNIAITGGKFIDDFSSYGVHLYKITE